MARNEAGVESDIDIALIINKDDDEMHDMFMDAIVDIDLDYDCVIVPSLIERGQFEQW